MSEILSPAEIVDEVEHSACAKAALPGGRLFTMAVLGGLYISLGGLLALVVCGNAPSLYAQNPGLGRFIFGALFPLGFIAVVLTGADLFTSNCATQMAPLQRGSLRPAETARVLATSYCGNFVGALIAALLFAHLTESFAAGQPATKFLISMARHKLDTPWATVFVKGILANLLVCLAAWQGYSARDTLGRMAALWFPVMAFVALGMEHSIANMFFIPAAMLAGLDVTVKHFFVANLIPATLGNLVGGALFIGLPYAWIYKRPVRSTENA